MDVNLPVAEQLPKNQENISIAVELGMLTRQQAEHSLVEISKYIRDPESYLLEGFI